MNINKSQHCEIIKNMLLSRYTELKINELFKKGIMHGTTHLSVGQEAIQAGMAYSLDSHDIIVPTHRGHGHYLLRGGNLTALVNELFGLEDGMCAGLSGSMHVYSKQHGVMLSSGIVSGGVGVAVGMAYSKQYHKESGVIVSILGDAAINQGMALESLNLASVLNVPVIFLCENNLYGISTPASEFVAAKSIVKRAGAFNIKSEIIDGNNVSEVMDVFKDAKSYCESGRGAYFIEAVTYRWLGHSKSDSMQYRTKDEEAYWRGKCPIKQYKQLLISENVLTKEQIFEIETGVIAEVSKVFDEALKRQSESNNTNLMELMNG